MIFAVFLHVAVNTMDKLQFYHLYLLFDYQLQYIL